MLILRKRQRYELFIPLLIAIVFTGWGFYSANSLSSMLGGVISIAIFRVLFHAKYGKFVGFILIVTWFLFFMFEMLACPSIKFPLVCINYENNWGLALFWGFSPTVLLFSLFLIFANTTMIFIGDKNVVD